MMSATVLDANIVCDSLGIDRSEVAAYRMKSAFPVENRPIILNTVAKMVGGKSRMHEWAPKLLDATIKIANKYQQEKGIIHTHNFAIMDYILENAPKNIAKRLLDQRKFGDKSEMLEHHAKTSNSIIIAPAMHEGVDLKDDLSRFQIICKVPYPNCFDDKQLARRVEIDRRYYNWLVALKIVQSYGRSIRSDTDYANTYVLDESFHKFIKDCDRMLPDWFKEAIQKENNA
jgi:Rad3-related DNA helicase